jgi:hypothetical protein
VLALGGIKAGGLDHIGADFSSKNVQFGPISPSLHALCVRTLSLFPGDRSLEFPRASRDHLRTAGI